jgi:hypothetical protein
MRLRGWRYENRYGLQQIIKNVDEEEAHARYTAVHVPKLSNALETSILIYIYKVSRLFIAWISTSSGMT